MGRALEIRQIALEALGMKQLLLLFAFFVHSIGFPMCTNGQTPLMEANDAFTCDRGCPLGFNCEYQDPYYTMSKAICCPNMTALQQIYGDEEHSEPIWDLMDVASLSVGLQPVTESTTLSTEATTTPSKEPLIVPEEATMEPQVETADASVEAPSTPETSTDPSDTVTVEDISANVEAQTEATPTTVIIRSSSEEERKSIEEMDKSLNQLEPIQETPITQTVTESTTELEGSGENETTKTSPTISSKSCARQKYSLTCHNGTTRTQATIRWWKNSETGECEFYPFGYCPGDRIIESVTIRTKAQCEKHCIKMEKASDVEDKDKSAEINVLETSTATVLELELNDKNVSSPLSQPIRIYPTTVPNSISDSQKGQEHLDKQLTGDEKVVGETVESALVKELHLTAEMSSKDSTLLSPKIAIEDPFAERKFESISGNSSATIEVDLTSEKQVQPPLSEVQEKVLAESQLSEVVEQGTSMPEMESPTFENEVAIGEKGNRILEQKAVPTQIEDQLAIGKESTEGIIIKSEIFEKVNVACSSTSYRFACENGHPSQFVYRWELVDGVCQSFPYGYCYGEFNHPHPRTHEECLVYCNSKSNRIFAF